MFFFPTFNDMLRQGRFDAAIRYAERHDMLLDVNVRGNLEQARKYFACKDDQERGKGIPLNASEQNRRLAALRAAKSNE